MKITKRVVCLLLVAIMVFTSSPLITLADELPLPGETPIEDPIPNEEPLDGDEVDPEDNNNNEDGDSKDLPDDESDEESAEDEEVEEGSDEETDSDEEEIVEVIENLNIYTATSYDWGANPTLETVMAQYDNAAPAYPKTVLLNPNFDYHPQLLGVDLEAFYEKWQPGVDYTSRSTIVLSDYDTDANGMLKPDANGKYKVSYQIEGIPASKTSITVDENWKTTEYSATEQCRIKDTYFEWANGYTGKLVSRNTAPKGYHDTYGSQLIINNGRHVPTGSHDGINPCVELDCNSPSTLYQDLKTNSKDLIIWSLHHTTRDTGNDQNIRVVIGKKEGSPLKTTTTPAPASNTKIAEVGSAVYTYNAGDPEDAKIKTINGANSGNGFAKKAELKALNLASGDSWGKASGVYLVPDGQTETRFAFQSLGTASSGNFLDDLEFKTLVGNLKVEQDPNNPGQIIVSGFYGGDPNEDPTIVYDFIKDGQPHVGELDMTGMPEGGGNFIAYVPVPSPDFDKVGVHVEGYPDTAGPTLLKEDVIKNVPPFTVTFVTNTRNGVSPSFTPSPQTVPWGTTATEPTEDIIDNNGYFNINKNGGPNVVWFYYVDGNPANTDPTNRVRYDFSQPVNANITLYAEWDGEDPLFTVTYDPANGQEPWLHGGIPYDGKTSTDITPTRDGKVFDGWDYYDESGNRVPFDFNTPIRRNYILIARYVNPPSNAPSPGIVIPTTAKRMAKTEESDFNIGYILLIIVLMSIALLATPKRRKR